MTRPHAYRVTASEHISRYREIMEVALELGIADIGRGESERNNAGPFVEATRAMDGTGLATDTGGPWCASWVSAKIVLACAQLRYRVPIVTSRSARTLGKRIAKHGQRIEAADWELLRPGDVGVLKRGKAGRAGHIFFVREVLADGVIVTVEANVGPYPAPVKSLRRDPEDPNLLFFARL